MQTQSRFLTWTLIIAIVIVVNLFVGYAISLSLSEPQYSDFCTQSQVMTNPTTETACVSAGGQWMAGTIAIPGYCNSDYVCGNNYSAAYALYERNVFIILVAVGILLLALGIFLKGNVVLENALSLSGVFSLIIASLRYWSSAGNWLKLVILGIALIALIFLAVKKFGNTHEKLRS